MQISNPLITRAGASLEVERIAWGASAWLFGSRALGCVHDESDWDVLILAPTGHDDRRRVGDIDLVTVTLTRSSRERWLASELAAHVARYGRLLKGGDDWTHAIDANEAGRRKTTRTLGRLVAVDRAWSNLNARYRSKRALALRRDIQRSLALADHGTVPPTFFLDQEWAEATRRERERALARLGADCSSELRRRVIEADVSPERRALSTIGPATGSTAADGTGILR